jgi:exodeoxyribonuclease-3
VKLKLLSYNIRHGGTGRESHIAKVVRACDPDLVVLQEAIDPSVVGSLAARTDMPVYASKKGFSLAFLSRSPVAEYCWHDLRELRRPFLEIKLSSGLTVFGVHLSAVHSNVTERIRIRELNALIRAIKRPSDYFHILTGDFNTLAPGEILELSRLPPRLRVVAWATGGAVRYKTIQIMLDNGYIDAYRSLHADRGFTFPTWDPHVRLDFAFFQAQKAEHLINCEVVHNTASVAEASDHFPLLTTIDVG